MEKTQELTFMGHLKELRSIIFKIVISLLIAMPISFYIVYYLDVFKYLKKPAIDKFPDLPIIFTEPTEMIATYIKVTLLLALVLALPYIAYQIVMFVRPALSNKERAYVYTMLPSITICFLLGAAFAYFILLPPAFNFMFSFGGDIAEPMIKVGKYISLLTTLMMWIGLVFEIPIVLFFLTKIGVIKPEWLTKYRKFFYIGAFILGAMITPTIDPINQALVAIPIIFLYEIGILLSKLAARSKKKTQT